MKVLLYVLILLYVLSPYDLFPDFFIGIGWIDDLIILGLLGWYHFIYKKRVPRPRERVHDSGPFEGEGAKAFEREKGHEEERDAYEILGIGRGASTEEISGAYRRLVGQYHPDKVNHLGEEFRVLAEKRFKEIQQAYQELKEKG